ncbi:unnamed protein product [Rhizoctonia solani]|uniref:BTB domain-containing protein n=1 Tax=Rhizoctonia solani TaxID=456999 RepID=A0A8H3GQQ3_9AGAM|nr:unnamed protein product [Rhizoctonia solani]
MAPNKSDKFYFPHGDLVVQLDRTLFRLHRDILRTHSGLFEDMLSMPSNDDTEGTESNPLSISRDLCSDQSFTILCKFMYPKRVGYRPKISAHDIEIWDYVLKATVALQMTHTRKVILDGLSDDAANIKSNPVEFFRISMDYEEAPRDLIVESLAILAYRCQRITPEEVGALGEKGTCYVNHTRERVREGLVLLSEGDNLRIEATPELLEYLGDKRSACRKAIFRKLIDNMSVSDKHRRTDNEASNIFDLGSCPRLCDSCVKQGSLNRRLFEAVFDRIVIRCVDEMIPASDPVESHMSLDD